MNSINLISLFLLVAVFFSVNCEKTCSLRGINEVNFLFGPSINVVDSEPLPYKGANFDKLLAQCPNLSNHELACCDTQQLDYIKGIIRLFFNTDKKECNDNYRDLLCELHCNPNQKKYINVLSKGKSSVYKGRYNLGKLSAKLDLESTDEFYKNCVNAKIFGKTIYEFLYKPESSPFLFNFLLTGTYETDYRFYDKKNNETFHLVKIESDDVKKPKFKKEPIVDSEELLPWVFRK